MNDVLAGMDTADSFIIEEHAASVAGFGRSSEMGGASIGRSAAGFC